MMNSRPSIDLNAIVRTIHDCQLQSDDTYAPVQTIHVNRQGQLIHGSQLSDQEKRVTAEVQQDIFHNGWEVAENRIVREKMPLNTYPFTTAEGIRGWIYSFQTEYLDTYRMFAYFDGSYYQVLVIDPQVETRFRNPHTGHIFDSGRICMGSGMQSGRKTLADAYAKSVLWANGFSAMIHGNLHKFPFNYND